MKRFTQSASEATVHHMTFKGQDIENIQRICFMHVYKRARLRICMFTYIYRRNI